MVNTQESCSQERRFIYEEYLPINMKDNLDEKFLDRYRGAIVGFAIGDALGMPAEFLTPTKIREHYHGKIDDFIEPYISHPNDSLKAGQYTDDTQLMLAVAESIIDKSGVDCEDISKKFVDLNKKGIRGIGSTTRHAINRLAKRDSWEHSSIMGLGCGGATRAVPLGLLYGLGQQYFNALVSDAEDVCRITHADTRAVISAIYVAYAISYLKNKIHPHNFNTDEFLIMSSAFIKQIEDEKKLEETLSDKVLNVKYLIGLNPDKAAKHLNPTSFTYDVIFVSLYAFLNSPDDFKKSLITAVNFGGDADSIGALTGALSGALNGYNDISSKWRKDIEDAERLVKVGTGLYKL